MNPVNSPLTGDANEEISALIEVLHKTGQRLEELTAGEVDTVADGDGRTLLLRHAQEQLRHSDAARQAAILNALPAHIALLDTQGLIISVNEAWRQFAGANVIQRPGYEVGVNYLEICDSAPGDDSSEAHQVAEGIRSVLGGGVKSFSIEYSCHSPAEQRWLLLTVTRLADDHRNGAVVMHLDITKRKRAEDRIRRLNRVYAVLSRINALIVRVRGRDELFKEACRIAVEAGAFRMAWIGVIDPQTLDGKVVAWHGGEEGYIDRVRLTARDGTPVSGRPACRALRQLQPVICNDITTDPSLEFRDDLLRRGHRSVGCFPLTVSGRPDAVIALFAGEPNVFDDEEMGLLRELAGNISFALEHIEKEEKIARLSRIQAVMGSINALIVRVRDRQELFDEACRIAVGHGGFGIAWIGTLDARTLDVVPVAHAGLQTNEFLGNFKASARADDPRGQGVVGRAIRERIPVSADDLSKELGAGERRKEALRRGYHSRIALPLLADNGVVGVMVLFARKPGFFNAEERKLLSELAGDLSFALEHINKEAKLNYLNRVYAVLSGINTLIVRVRDRDELFREACRIAVEHGKFQMAWIGVVDRSAMKIVPVASAGVDQETLTAIKERFSSSEGALLGSSIAAEAIRDKKAVVSKDLQSNSKIALRKKYAESGIHSMAIFPLIASDEAVGVLALYASEIEFFHEEEMKLLTELAGDVAFAIDHIDKQERLDFFAYYDVLTGLANRRLFLERVAQYMRSAVSGGHKLALYLIDLERFKNINDSLGRAAGDALLRQAAEWLTRSAGDANLLARVGADHFGVVLPEVNQEGEVARRLEKTMEAFLDHPFRLDDAVFRIAAKVGVALFPDDGADADTLFRNAEAALKKAKASGDRYLFYTQKMTEAVAGKLALENQLRQALDKEEFVLHYQPKVNLASGKLTSAEALIRWNDPRTGLVPPGRFIPVLEETGLIHEVGRWALRKAIEDYLRWRAAGLTAVRIAVNVSPLQLRNRGFIGEIEQTIGIDAHAAAGLELEITESLIMADVKHSIASLNAIRALGVTIAIDDFGTGFSSLSYLSKLPVDTLKIDRSFVNDMTGAPEGLALVSTIINLAHALTLKVVAEGVETEEQSRLLRLLNCDEMQGFLFSKPVPSEIFETRFLASSPAGDKAALIPG